jgi:hypothetical protein
LFILLVLSCVVPCCSTKISHIEHDPTFTEAALERGGLAIGGVTTVEAVTDVQDLSRRYAPLLRRKLLGERSVSIREWGELKGLLGDERMARCIDGYRETGRADAEVLGNLHDALGATQYVVFARIEGNVVEREETDKDEMQDGKMVTVGHKRKTRRRLTVGFRVYDLMTGADVWNAIVEGKSENEKTVAVDDEDDSVLEAIVEVLLDDDTASEYPEPPDVSEVLEKVFDRFAKRVAVAEK